MYKTRIEKDHFNENGSLISSRIIIEVPLPLELLQDCYSYTAMDAPSEIKRMLMESVGVAVDEIILGNRPEYINEQWLKSKLTKVKVL
jgi:hypothetical protein